MTKKKKIASNMKDIILSEIDLKETTFKNNNDVVYYSLDIVSDNSSNNSDKSLNLDEYDLNIDDLNIDDLNIDDFKVDNNQSEIKNINIDSNYNLKNLENLENVQNNESVKNNDNNENIENISTNKLLDEIDKNSTNKDIDIIDKKIQNNLELNNLDTSKIKLNTSEFFNILNNNYKSNNIDTELKDINYKNNEKYTVIEELTEKNIDKFNQQNKQNIIELNQNINQHKCNEINISNEQHNVQNIANQEQLTSKPNILINQNNKENNVEKDVENNVENDEDNKEENDEDNKEENDEDNKEENNLKKNKNLNEIETNEKLNIWRDLIETKDNLYSSYNYLQTETQSNNLVDLINKNILFKFYKLAENNKKNISGYIDNKKILNCSPNKTYKYEVHTKITNICIDPPGNYINLLFNKDLDIIKCIFLLNNNGYWTMEPMENFSIFKDDIYKQKVLLTYFIILKILFCNKYYPFNEGNSIQKYRNLTKNINFNIINHINKNIKFKNYVNDQIKNVYRQEDSIDNILDIINNNNINKYYGRILKLKYKYY